MLSRRVLAAMNSFFIRINFNFCLHSSTDCQFRLVLLSHYKLFEGLEFFKLLFTKDRFRDVYLIDFEVNGNSYI